MRLALTLLGFGTAVSIGTAQTPEAWVTKLRAGTYQERQQAQAELVALGAQATAAVEPLLADPDAEVRSRAGAIRRAIALQVASASAQRVSPVTLDYVDRPVGDALADLARKTGFSLRLDDAVLKTQRVTVRSGPLAPWEAVERFRQSAGLVEVLVSRTPPERIDPNAINRGFVMPPIVMPQAVDGRLIAPHGGTAPDPAAVVFTTGTGAAWPGDYAGLIRVRVLPANDPAHLHNRSSEVKTLALDLAGPNDLITGGDWRVVVTEATDHRGRPLAQVFPEGPGDESDDGMMIRRVFVRGNLGLNNELFYTPPGAFHPRLHFLHLEADPHASSQLATLKGVVAGRVAVKNQVVLEVPRLEAAIGRTHRLPDGRSLEVLSVAPSKSGTVVKVAVGMMAQGAMHIGSHQFTVDSNSMFEFRTAAGVAGPPPRVLGMDVQHIQSPTLQVTFEFPAGQVPAAMAVKGTRYEPVELPFCLKGVRVP